MATLLLHIGIISWYVLTFGVLRILLFVINDSGAAQSLTWITRGKSKLENLLVAADQEGMIRGPFVTKPFIGILACSYATGG